MNLIPTIIQNVDTQQVLMLGYMSKASLQKTKETGRVWFYSRSKQRLWEKGETSGNYLSVVSIAEDCDHDALLIKVEPYGPTCHTGQISCFDLAALEKIIQERKHSQPVNSYTVQLLQAGTKAIALKVIEEAIEVVQAARFESRERLAEESADLLYHLLVLLADKAVLWKEVMAKLDARRQ